MFDYIKVINAPADSATVKDVIKKYDLTETQKSPPDGRYQGSRKKGLDLLIRKEIVVGIQIFVQPAQGNDAFGEDLPSGLKPGMTQSEIHALLGPPAVGNKTVSRYPLPAMKTTLVVKCDTKGILSAIHLESGGA